MHARHDVMTVSAPGRAAARRKLDERLLAEIDPDNVLDADERSRRLAHARSAYYARLAFEKARKARSRMVRSSAKGGRDATRRT
jgi:hypothetical protein